jgi:hypothetical protein
MWLPLRASVGGHGRLEPLGQAVEVVEALDGDLLLLALGAVEEADALLRPVEVEAHDRPAVVVVEQDASLRALPWHATVGV